MISPEEEQELNAYHAEQAKIAMTEAQQRAYDQAQVMLAFSQGRKIEFRDRASSSPSWKPIAHPPLWDWQCSNYRIAPEPQEVWLWLGGKREDKIFDWPGCCEQDMKDQGYTKKLFREVC